MDRLARISFVDDHIEVPVPGGSAIGGRTNMAAAKLSFSRGLPRKRQENGVEVPTGGDDPKL
eukprot:scaffold159296_cov83-Cyclotella_meneghiniana.AAC.1